MILPEQRFYQDLIAQFCSKYNLGKPPAKLELLDKNQYPIETGDTEMLTSYLVGKDKIVLSPTIFELPGIVLHELCHHFQALRLGLIEYAKRYKQLLKTYGYDSHPYELEAEEFAKKWWVEFASLIKQKMEE